MKDKLKTFLDTPFVKSVDTLQELRNLYAEIGEKPTKCDSETCINKMLVAVRKHYHLTYEAPEVEPEKRKYTLKPGIHAFTPGPSVHTNENTTDAEIEHYLIAYPHIEKLLIK